MSELLRISNLVSYLVGVVGILLSVYFYEVSQPEVAISYRKSSVQLYKRLEDEFKIYQGNSELKDIKSIVRTRVVFWNSGNAPVKIDELRSRPQISFSHETQLLEASGEQRGEGSLGRNGGAKAYDEGGLAIVGVKVRRFR